MRNPWVPTEFWTGAGDAGAGFAQGVTFNFGDDLLRLAGGETADDWLAEAQRRNPLLYGAGNVLGAMTGPIKLGVGTGDFVRRGATAAVDLLPTRLLARGLKGTSDDLGQLTAKDFIGRAATNDAAAGALYGVGGYEVAENGAFDNRSRIDVANQALVHGFVGAGLGAGAAAAAPLLGRYAQRAALNAPTGRGLPPRDAPLALTPAALAGRNLRELDPESMRTAAYGLVDDALGRDEALRRLAAGGPVIQSGLPSRTALDAAGPNVQSLFGLIARDPEGRAQAMAQVGKSAKQNVSARLDALTFDGMPVQTTQVVMRGKEAALQPLPPPSTMRVQDLVDALDDPDAHAEWMKLAKALRARGAPLKSKALESSEQFQARALAHNAHLTAKAQEARDLAQQVAARLKQQVKEASPEQALALYRRLESGDLAEKLKAVGLKMTMPKELAAGLAASDASLRAVVGATGTPPRFTRAAEIVERDAKTGAPIRRRKAEPSTDDLIVADSPYRQPVGREDLDGAPRAAFDPTVQRYMIDALQAPRRMSYRPTATGEGPLIGTAPDFRPRRVNMATKATTADKGFYYAGKAAPIVAEQELAGQDGALSGFLKMLDYYTRANQTSANAGSRNPWLPAFS
jgi:hypothetical protein